MKKYINRNILKEKSTKKTKYFDTTIKDLMIELFKRKQTKN